MASTHFDRLRFFVDWGKTGSFVEETTRVLSASGTWRRNNPEDSITSPRGIVAQASVTLINHDLRYSTVNALSPLAARIADGGYYQSPCYITINGPLPADRVFTGIIKGPRETGGALDAIGQITFDCRANEELLLQRKISTLYADFRGYYARGNNEADLIAEWLNQAGAGALAPGSDAGGFIIPWAWLDDESVLEDIWQLAASGGGAFYSDPTGAYFYESMAGWIDNLSATAENFTDGDYKRGSVRVNDDELYKTVAVEVQPRQVAGSATIWESPEQISIPSGATKRVVASLGQPVYFIDPPLYQATTSGGQDITASVGLGATYYAQHVDLDFTNSDPIHSAEIKAFHLTGRSVTGGPLSEVEKVSTDAFWTDRPGRSRNLSNQYIQTTPHATALAQFLLDRHETPRVFYILSDCIGDTARRLGQRIIVKAGNLVRSDRPALVTGLSWRWSGQGGFSQTIEAFDCFDLFAYTITNPITLAVSNLYCKLDTSLLDDDKVCFY